MWNTFLTRDEEHDVENYKEHDVEYDGMRDEEHDM